MRELGPRGLTGLVLVLAMIVTACGNGTGSDTTTTVESSETTSTLSSTTTSSGADTTTTEAASGIRCDEPVKVGLIMDQSGPLAIYGIQIVRSFDLGMEYATGAPGVDGVYQLGDCQIEILSRDDQSNEETAATMTRELIEAEDIDIIIGSGSSAATAAIQGLSAEAGRIHIVPAAAANELTGPLFNPNSFRVSRNNYQDAINICEYLTQQYDTFVQIAPDYSFGHGSAAAFRDACTLMGGEFVGDDVFAPADTTEFTPYVEQLQAANADAFIVTWAGQGFIPLVQAASDTGLLEESEMASGFIDNQLMPVFFANAVGTTSGILFHYTLEENNPINDWLTEQMLERNGIPPDAFDADGMNAAIFLIEALKATGGDTNPDVLRPAMEGMTFEGPKGLIEIRPEDHVAIQNMYIATLTNVDDPEARFYELVEVNRPEPPCLLEGEYLDRCGDLPVGNLSGS
jgi:branched-chain amino acid transport system substrate-binding protein